MTKAKANKIKTNDWRNLPIEKWNTTTFTAYLEHLTKEKFGVTYEPTGGGSKAQRWSREKGMMKNALTKYGPEVLRKFIEICIAEYHAKPQYPYASFAFMYSYMSDRFARAEAAVKREQERLEMAERDTVRQDGLSDSSNIDEEWF